MADGITMVLFQGDVEYAKSHGVVKLGNEVQYMCYATTLYDCSSIYKGK